MRINPIIENLVQKPSFGLDMLRVTISFVLVSHAIFRIYHQDVEALGGFLAEAGVMFSVPTAWLVTLLSIAFSVAMFVPSLIIYGCMGHMLILSVGIVLAHRFNGWFVVGAGVGGMEFSVTLLVGLLAIIWGQFALKKSLRVS